MFKIVRVDSNCQSDAMQIEREVIKDVPDVLLENLACDTAAQTIEAAKDADVIITHAADISKDVLKALPKCRAVVRYGVGYDTVDVPAATEFGVLVINVPDFCSEEVSNHVFAFLLAACKKLLPLNEMVRKGKWNEAKAMQVPMFSIHGQTLGIIGCGNLGRTVAKKSQAFQMQVLGYDKYLPDNVAKSAGIELVPLDRLLEESDFITLHVALTEETRHLISTKELQKMKKNAILINTSRGVVVDEKALIEALSDGEISMACLDVFEEEPLPQNSAIFSLDNVILTPHCASYSDAAFDRLKRSVMQEALRVIRNERPFNVVNKSVNPKVPLR